jgi:hypothetical protein
MYIYKNIYCVPLIIADKNISTEICTQEWVVINLELHTGLSLFVCVYLGTEYMCI